MAFNFIIYNAVRFSSLRFTVEKFCQKRNEPVDVVAFLWKRQGIDYSAGWLYFYHMASCCLSTHSSPVLDILADLRDNRDTKFRDLDFLYFEEVFSSCRWVPKLIQPAFHRYFLNELNFMIGTLSTRNSRQPFSSGIGMVKVSACSTSLS